MSSGCQDAWRTRDFALAADLRGFVESTGRPRVKTPQGSRIWDALFSAIRKYRPIPSVEEPAGIGRRSGKERSPLALQLFFVSHRAEVVGID